MAKLTAAKIKEQTKKIQQAIEKEKSRYRDQNFTEVKPKDIERKLKRIKSPMIVFQAWSGSAPAGGTINYNVGIWNPTRVRLSGCSPMPGSDPATWIPRSVRSC
jgi:hypothetical protein